ncbi:unnamed protein product, partial [Linum tenue]
VDGGRIAEIHGAEIQVRREIPALPLERHSFGPYVNDLGCMRLLDPLSPFVKLEVVPSGSDPAHLIHLRCCHNNKFVQLDSKYGVSWISATANGPDESTAVHLHPIFRPSSRRACEN